MEECVKAINFDLRISDIVVHYPGKRVVDAYDVRKELHKLGFNHRQGSGYISEKVMSELEVRFVVSSLSKRLPWLCQCVKEFDVTDVGEKLSFKHIFEADMELQIMEETLKPTLALEYEDIWVEDIEL